MNTFNELLRVSCFGCFGLLALFLILLALPQSRLRYYVLRILAVVFFTVAGLFALYIISPADIVPDVIPILGQIDDVAALVGLVLTVMSAVAAWRNTRRPGAVGRVDMGQVDGPPQLPRGR